MNFIRKHRNVCLRMMDILIIAISYYGAKVLLSNSLFIDNEQIFRLCLTIGVAIVVYGVILQIFRTYKNTTRYENGIDYLIYVLACVISCVTMIFLHIVTGRRFVEIRATILASILISTMIIGYRVVLRALLTIKHRLEETADEEKDKVKNSTDKKNVLVIGAGEGTKILLGTLRSSMKDTYNVVGLVDDNVNKVKYAISGYKILGTRNDIPRICSENHVDLIFFAISNISNTDRRKILEICQETGCKVRILPGTKELIKSKSLMQNFRNVEIEDLLGREPIKLENKSIEKLIKDKVVLVTGGGGSIGSELCRQIIKFNPERLVMVDIYENNLYSIEQELRFNYPDKNIDAIIASVRDKKRLDEIFAEYKPYLVFHAAAHKHVPLMEVSPLEAIKNNVFGTYNVVNCADEFDVKRFILISTDKAVNPTNIMGATKRLCEMIVQAKNKVSKTEYAAVRFGNVLGSNGSVVPLFKKQIEMGGPVTVTHKEITRFFMTIPEAVSLVLQAMSGAEGGEIFVLDMGEPVKIYDMAEKLIRLSGLEPNVDIQIKVTGLRPGEKLYEELLMSEEGLTETKHDKIHIAKPMNINMDMLNGKLEKLQHLLDNNVNEDKRVIKDTIKDIVPTYREPNAENYIRKEDLNEIETTQVENTETNNSDCEKKSAATATV